MRTDVANLLERLGKREFQYQEFADRFADVELWPLFETLIRDPRILTTEPAQIAEVAAPTPQVAAAPVATATVIEPAPIDRTPVPVSAPGDLAALFARYGGGTSDDTPGDVHALLQKLAQQLEQGKL